MADINSLCESVFSVNTSIFDQLALEIFRLQYERNEVYSGFVNALDINTDSVAKVTEIPFLPISFFKTHHVKTGNWKASDTFQSSGTTEAKTSKHHIYNIDFYLNNCLSGFEAQYGAADSYTILALLPSYFERGNSGLIAMVNYLIKCSKTAFSGFYLDEYQQLYERLKFLKVTKDKTLLIGVTFALLDFAEAFKIDFPDLIVMETGGMKGRGKEVIREDVHKSLCAAFGVERIHSEYGMTELCSQAYSPGGGIFLPASTMKVMGRDLNDPFHYPFEGRNAGLNVIDLANIHTCAFVETQDMGRVYKDGSFQVKGRIDNSEIRGCNLLL